VEPRANGIGGDAFVLYWAAGADGADGLDGAGPTAAAATIDAIRAAGYDEMPTTGPWTITVPGAVDTWCKLLERHGRLGLEAALQPAIRYATEGFKVTPVIADEWAMHAHRIQADAVAAAVFLPGGRAPAAGERFSNPEMGALLRAIANVGRDAFYQGRTAERIGAAVAAAGGPLRASDLRSWEGARWVQPLVGSYRGINVIEMPPPSQGFITLEALRIFQALESGVGDRAHEEHHAIEAIKVAFSDAGRHLADPLVVDVPVEQLLTGDHVTMSAARINDRAADVKAPGPPADTVYVAVVDSEGSACSLIQSLYSGFGAGVGVPGLGITLQNRGKGFVLHDGHPNVLAPRKRPYHTIIPAMLTRDGAFHGCLGVVGGFMQPQGQMQIIRHLVDRRMSVFDAVAAPRVRFMDQTRIGVEPGFDAGVATELRRHGHELVELSNFGAGGAQLIIRDGDKLLGVSDPRKDGCVSSTELPRIGTRKEKQNDNAVRPGRAAGAR
jgi:gamma-glutamyltranspeptidase/glutathione hydrolase